VPAGEKGSWKSGPQLVTNGFSPSQGSSGLMIEVFPFGIWPRILGNGNRVLDFSGVDVI
jgi:hypothetical protein